MALKETLERILEQLSDYERECLMNSYMLANVSDIFKEHCDSWELMDSYGGEDMGSEYWSVYSFSKGSEKFFVKFYGWYASHNGSEYQGYKFVTPKEETVIFYQ